MSPRKLPAAALLVFVGCASAPPRPPPSPPPVAQADPEESPSVATPEDPLSLGKKLIQHGKLDAAAHALQDAAAGPERGEALPLLGDVLVRLGRWDEAIAALREAVKNKPSDGDLQQALGEAELERGHGDKAIQALREAARLKPDSAAIHERLAKALLERSRQGARTLDEAIRTLREAVRLAPKETAPKIELAEALFDRGDSAGAERTFRDVIQGHPTEAEPRYRLGVLYEAEGRWEEAATSFAQTAAIRPEHIEALTRLGYAQEMLGRKREAVEAFGKVDELLLPPNERRLTFHHALTEGVTAPSFSPDGKRIVFAEPEDSDVFRRRDGGTLRIVWVDPSSESTTLQVEGLNYNDFLFPAWSTDGASIDYACEGGIYRVGVDGSDNDRIFPSVFDERWSRGETAVGKAVAWSHSGERLAFSLFDRSEWWVALIDPSGEEQVRLRLGENGAEGLSWSPDDGTLLVNQDYYEGRNLLHRILRCTLKPPRCETAWDDPWSSGAFLPDGRVAAVYTRTGDLWVLGPGRSRSLLHGFRRMLGRKEGGGGEGMVRVAGLTVAPDGKSLVYVERLHLGSAGEANVRWVGFPKGIRTGPPPSNHVPAPR